jgi:NADH-quinone oxidoreductase subunit M
LLILIGAFKSNIWFAALATLGLVFGAVYLLWMYKRVMYGEITHNENKLLKDMTRREYAYLLPIVFFIVWIGLFPKPFLDKMTTSVEHLLQKVNDQKARNTLTIDGQKIAVLNLNYTLQNRALTGRE